MATATMSPGTMPPHQQQQQQAQQALTDADRLRQSLSLKIVQQRCEQTLGVLSAASTKDEFPSLVGATIETIFATYAGAAWELRTLNRAGAASSIQASNDFAVTSTFLNAGGPFLEMIYRLTTDSGVVFNFPVTFLPAPARKKIQAGVVPQFYRNKIKTPAGIQSGGLHPLPALPNITHLSLNAFEYFLFHFAFYLVNPSQARLLQLQQQQQTPNDCLFSCILEHYLKAFLPAGSSADESLPPLSTYASFRSWASPASCGPVVPTPRSPASATSPFKSGLLKQNLCVSPNANNATAIHGFANESDGGLFRKSWRSETFLSVLAEFWLNQNEIEDGDSAITSVTTQVSLPSLELVRYVRQTIKQVHYFANSNRGSQPPPPFPGGEIGNQLDTSMEEFRQAAIPIFLQKQIYAFLRFGFEKWPLDQGFRMMLETWLSYIQPWRYVDPNVGEKEEERADEVEEEWLTGGFIGDNLLHFVVPFQDFLKRLFRMDLSSPKNAIMLYRVCKVFNQPRLKEYLSRTEQSLTSPSLLSAAALHSAPPSHRGALQDSFFDGASFLSPSNGFGAAGAQGVSAHLAQMEKPEFVYRPLLGVETRGSVEQLLQVIVQALGTTKSLLPKPPTKTPDEGGNVILKFFAATLGLFSTSGDNVLSDEMTLADVNRMDFHLKTSLQHLLDFFDLEAPNNVSSSSSASSNPSSGDQTTLAGEGRGRPNAQTLGPNAPDNVDGVPTDLGRWQMSNGLRHFDAPSIGFQGDPDLHPILSVESAFLVRLLYRLSSALNHKYGPIMERCYGRSDLVGRVIRQFLLAPCIGVGGGRGGGGEDLGDASDGNDSSFSPPHLRRRRQRPRQTVGRYSSKPRLSLRFLANKQTLGWILCGLLFAPAIGVPRIAFLFCLPIFTLFIGVVMALVKLKFP